MQSNMFRIFIGLFLLSISPTLLRAQYSFVDEQKASFKIAGVFNNKEQVLQKEFEAKGLQWPAKFVYIRSFKYDSQLEVWVKNNAKDKYKLFKTYKVCMQSGTMGPKRLQGDYQVPEGFYYINEFNPRSAYHLSLGLNYPNASDRILSDSLRPGGAIYIHGSCVTVGCIPIRDEQIDELYILAAHAKDQGQDFIPVHIFPIRFTKEKSVKYLENLTKDDPSLKKFANRLEDAFDYFEKYRQLPVIMIDEKGGYSVYDVPPRKQAGFVAEKPVKKPAMQHRTRNVGELAESVQQWPQYPGGGDVFIKYLDQLGKDMIKYLPASVKKVFVQVEFIIDKDGVPVNFKVLKGLKDGDDFNDELINRLENMGTWKPAILHDKPVAKKMIQTVTVEIPVEAE